MLEQLKLLMANQYFDRRMKMVFIDTVSGKGIETFEIYLAYRYRNECYYYSGYAIMGLKNDDYLIRGELCISGDDLWGNGGYSHGWVEFKYKNQEYVFDSMCKGVIPKAEWYEEFKPKVKFRHTKEEIVKSIMADARKLKRNCYEVQNVKIANGTYYTIDIFRNGKLFMYGDKVKKFIAYSEPSG